MKTYYPHKYTIEEGKRKSIAHVPTLQDLDDIAGVGKVLVRDPNTGEMKEQNFSSDTSYAYWIFHAAGFVHHIHNLMEVELATGSPSLSFSRQGFHGGFKFTLHNNGGIPIEDLGTGSSFNLQINEDKLYKMTLNGMTTIDITGFKANVSHTILIHIKAITNFLNPFRPIFWRSNGENLPTSCWHMDNPLTNVGATENRLVSITNHGGTKEDLAISFINIKS